MARGVPRGSLVSRNDEWVLQLVQACDGRQDIVDFCAVQPASDSECQALWGNIASAGIDMDDFSDDWNDVVLDSATLLIEEGCVQNTRRGF